MEFFTIINFVLVFLGLLIGFVISKFLEKTSITKSLENAKKETENILKSASIEGENIKKDKIFQAKEKFLELKSEHEQEILNKDKRIAEIEKRTRDKESQVSSELAKAKKVNDDYEAKTTEYTSKIELLDKKQQELEKLPDVLKIHPSDANFLLVQVPDANRFYEGLIEEKVIVRNRSTVLHCEGCLRITVGTRDETLALLQAFKKIATN